jgi:hypothetical protein
MRVYCELSGVEFQVENFLRVRVQHVHPLFYLPVKDLLMLGAQWSTGELTSVRERRLLFLALVNATGYVRWEATAEIADSTVQLNMEAMIKLVGWNNLILHPQFALPELVVNATTRRMTHVKQWILACESVKTEWERGARINYLKKKLASREAALERLLKSPMTRTSDETRRTTQLANWAMEAANVPKEKREAWTAMFYLKDVALLNANPELLREMYNWLEAHIDHYEKGFFSHAVMRHVRGLIELNSKGLGNYLGYTMDKLQADQQRPYIIVEDESEAYNKKVQASLAPATKPRPEDFATKVEYILAKARYDLAAAEEERKAAEAAKLEELLKKQLEQDIATNIDAGEEDGDEDAVIRGIVRPIQPEEGE